MTRPTLRRGAAFTAAAALLAGLAVAVPMTAQGAGSTPTVAFVDSTVPSAAALTSLAADGTGPATLLNPAGLQTSFFAASSDTATSASTVVTGVRTIGPVVANTTSALVVTHAGVSKVLSTYTDVNPVVSADGLFVWFLVRGNLYKYDVALGTTLQINGAAQFNPWAAAAGSHSYIYRLAISTDGSKAAELLQSYPNSGGAGVNRSQIRVFDISQTGANFVSAPIWTSNNYLGNGVADKQLLPYNFVFTDDKTLVLGECINDPCATWTTWGVDTLAAADGTTTMATATGVTALINLDNLLGLRSAAGTWYAWALDNVTAHTITPSTTTDSTFATALTAGAVWPVGSDKYFAYITPLADIPATFTGLSAKMSVAPTLVLSKSAVVTGTRVTFNAFGTYPSPASGQILQKETATVGRGTLQYSLNGGATWAKLVTTTAGGGSTQLLSRTTKFRWLYPGDALTNPATSVVRTVSVAPSLSVKVTRSGSSKVVSGVTSRIGGTVALWKLSGRTWKKLFTTPVKTRGAYSFGKRSLVTGTYRTITLADASWISAAKTFKI